MASPFPAGNSGGEPSSGEESAGPEEEARALAEQFERAAERLPGLMQVATREQLLYLYARYKQVKFGNCNTPKPSFFDFEGKQKWEAWKALRDSSPHQAMQEYIATVKKLDPSWNPQTPEKSRKEGKTGFGGPVVSSLYQEETIRAGLCFTGHVIEDTRSSSQYCYSMRPILTSRMTKARQHCIMETRLHFWNCTKFTLQWAAVVDWGGGIVELWKRVWGAILHIVSDPSPALLSQLWLCSLQREDRRLVVWGSPGFCVLNSFLPS
ncbi:acyl-CoA-binding domain-containing protein 6 isoform X2 [Gopherus flavomarginatus]|uniref:acyl-CoA-binding domain-containing protein 6 isoform X2 n=1 Tax=Gopherus flavomarginatus TaxID=286002 RepID=UPI0021CBF7FB|nr:acyl-CoA-binding domain-containing protein 6 isoform X2 [Gopherus flavomarginatus]